MVNQGLHQAIYEKLLSVAKTKDITTYGQIAPLAGLDMESPADRDEIGRLLGEISTFEHQHNRPMLSAVVVHKDDKTPGHGFFELARSLGLYVGGDDDAFFVRELRRAHDYWSANC